MKLVSLPLIWEHILARRARLPKGDLPPLAFPLPAKAETLTLYKSTLDREGATYKPLYQRALISCSENPNS